MSQVDHDKQLTTVKNEIRGLLISSPKGVTIRQLMIDYEKQLGKKLPHADFGFRNPADFLLTLQDTVKLQNGILIPVCSTKVSHIDALVSKQKNTTKRCRAEIIDKQIRKPVQLPLETKKNAAESMSYHEGGYLHYYGHPDESSIGKTKKEGSTGKGSHLHNAYQSESLNGEYKKSLENEEDESMYNWRIQKGLNNIESPNSDGTKNSFDDGICSDAKYTNGPTLCDPVGYEENYNREVQDSLIIPDSLKQKLRGLLAENPDGIPSSKLLKKFKEKYDYHFHYSEYQCPSVMHFVCGLPNIFRWEKGRGFSEYILYDTMQPITAENKQKWIPQITQAKVEELSKEYPDGISEDDFHHLYKMSFLSKMFFGNDECNPTFSYTKIDTSALVLKLLRVNICDVITPNNIWMQIESNLDELNKMMFELNEYYNNYEGNHILDPAAVTEDLACTVRFEMDKRWHRCKIIQFAEASRSKVEVHYVDYGTVNIVQVSSLRKLASMFANLPAQAINATLDQLTFPPGCNDWNSRAIDFIYYTTYNQKFKAEIVRVNEDSMKLQVILYKIDDDGETINDMLINAGFAVHSSMVPIDHDLINPVTNEPANRFLTIDDPVIGETVEDHGKRVRTPPGYPSSTSAFQPISDPTLLTGSPYEAFQQLLSEFYKVCERLNQIEQKIKDMEAQKPCRCNHAQEQKEWPMMAPVQQECIQGMPLFHQGYHHQVPNSFNPPMANRPTIPFPGMSGPMGYRGPPMAQPQGPPMLHRPPQPQGPPMLHHPPQPQGPYNYYQSVPWPLNNVPRHPNQSSVLPPLAVQIPPKGQMLAPPPPRGHLPPSSKLSLAKPEPAPTTNDPNQDNPSTKQTEDSQPKESPRLALQNETNLETVENQKHLSPSNLSEDIPDPDLKPLNNNASNLKQINDSPENIIEQNSSDDYFSPEEGIVDYRDLQSGVYENEKEPSDNGVKVFEDSYLDDYLNSADSDSYQVQDMSKRIMKIRVAGSMYEDGGVMHLLLIKENSLKKLVVPLFQLLKNFSLDADLDAFITKCKELDLPITDIFYADHPQVFQQLRKENILIDGTLNIYVVDLDQVVSILDQICPPNYPELDEIKEIFQNVSEDVSVEDEFWYH